MNWITFRLIFFILQDEVDLSVEFLSNISSIKIFKTFVNTRIS